MRSTLTARRLLSIIVVALSFAAVARGDEVLNRTIPGKWIEPLVPESDPEPFYPDYVRDNPLAMAKAQMNAGQYRRCLATLAGIHGDTVPDIAIVRAKALAGLGRLDKAIEVLSRPELVSDLPSQVMLADLLGQMERYPEALKLLNDLLAQHPQSIAAHYYLGWYLERSGDYVAALKAYQWFSDSPQRYADQWRGHPKSFTNAQEVVLIGKALDRWATLGGAYQQDPSLHNLILSMFTAAYQRIDTEDYAAHTAAAEYFIAHDDPNEAVKELTGALAGNPHDMAAHALAGRIAVDGFNFAAAEGQVAEIRDTDEDSAAADLLEARDLLQQRRPKDALVPLNVVLAKFPSDIEAIGLSAAAQALLLNDTAVNDLLKQADDAQPNSPEAYFEVAEQLSGMRQYERSATMYKVALKRAPWWTSVRDGLGLLMTQSGDEDLARVVLEAAHAVDPFNVRALNYLKLLDQMDKFAKKESAHFIVMYDATEDPVIPEYFSDYLETIYKDVTRDFKYEPKVKTYIEVFPTHEAFSVRTVGAPWIATVGASTGRVIALAAPRAGAGGAFNWSRVVRHEFTHTVTLGLTDNRIPLWFTEGLAVWEEHSPLQWEWVPMLQDAVNNHKLFPLQNLTWAFVRPKEASDRQLAYAESYWICTYIEQKYGHQAILDLVDQTRQGHDLDVMFPAALHETSDQFFDEFQAWAQKQVDGWGYDDVSSAKYDVLVEEADPLIAAQDYAGAAKKWEQIEKIRPMDLLPHERLMGIYLQLKDWDKACGELEILSKVELKDNRYTKVLARLYDRAGKDDLACQRALQAVYINPYDLAAHQLLAELASKTGQTALADREQRVIPILQKWLDENHDTGDGSRAPPPTAQ
jgi:tetratricopeptide (TPR) repeat protein